MVEQQHVILAGHVPAELVEKRLHLGASRLVTWYYNSDGCRPIGEVIRVARSWLGSDRPV
jgi:hypothetical protein